MQMSSVFEVVGTTGSLIVCASAIPQAVKTYRIKRSCDLSIVYLGVLMLGIGLLQSYSLYIRDFVFILGNTLSMLSTGILIVLWFRYRERLTSAKSSPSTQLTAGPSTSFLPSHKGAVGQFDKLTAGKQGRPFDAAQNRQGCGGQANAYLLHNKHRSCIMLKELS